MAPAALAFEAFIPGQSVHQEDADHAADAGLAEQPLVNPHLTTPPDWRCEDLLFEYSGHKACKRVLI
jgi:hypothetical protein